MIVTVDGPAGAGKSTIARRLADRLQFEFLDTGAMYRAVTFAADRAGIPPEDDAGLEKLLAAMELTAVGSRTLLDAEDVSEAIRVPRVSERVTEFADRPIVRSYLTAQQRRTAEGRNLVSDGRDQGTIVFPNAACKFFITARPEVRASRRLSDYAARGRQATLAEVLEEQTRRDARDEQRAIAPLMPASDAHLVDTSELDIDAVLDRLERLVRQIPGFPAPDR